MTIQEQNICVFYDGACPICRREINSFKKLATRKKSKEQINWIDISQSQAELEKEGINYQDAMALIHIKDSSGVHQVGIDAIFTLWDQLPYYRHVSGFLRKIPIIKPLLSSAYAFFARHRMKIPGRVG